MKLSIEYAHIYGNQDPEQEQEIAVKIALELSESLKKNHDISTVVMIDDYNSSLDKNFPGDYVHWLSDQGLGPDFVTFESYCIPHAKKMLESFESIKPGGVKAGIYDKGEKRYLFIPHQKKVKLIENTHYECSLLASILDSAKLGAFDLEGFKVDSKGLSKSVVPVADKSIVILPKTYRIVEDKAMQILNASKYTGYTNNLHHLYFGADANIEKFLEGIL